jgi:predicted ATPase
MNSTDRDDFSGTARFAVVRRLGAGGMGVVYEVLDRERNTRVALKTLRRLDPTALYRFKQEFRSLAEVLHPNLVPLYEFISDGSRWFFTMELIDDAVDFLSYVRPQAAAADGEPPSDDAQTPTLAGPARAAERPAGTTDHLVAPEPTDPTTELPAENEGPLVETEDRPSAASTAPEPTVAQAAGPPPDGATTLAPKHPAAAPAGPRPGREAGPCLSLEGFDFARLRDAFLQLADGVCALHAAGKLHRDLKPGNALVRPGGRVVLLDFGLVAELAADPLAHPEVPRRHAAERLAHHSTDDGYVSGTIAYMSPEQAAAEPLTPASDWYAVGVMLFRALTGRLPITGAPLRVLRDKQLLDPPAPASLVAGVPDDLNALCVALLNRDPAARPTGAEVLAALSGTAVPESEAAPPPGGEALPFVGRERQLAELARAFDAVRAGRPLVYHVHGKSGAGKSALLQRFLHDLAGHGGAVVLAGRCYEQESVPYKAVDSLVDALTRYLLRRPAEELTALLPADVAALARVFPVLNRVPAVARASAAAGDESDLRELRHRAFAAMRELLACLGARHPLVLAIDDLQWGDVDSAALLTDLLRPPDAPRLLLLVAYRSEYVESSACLRALTAADAAAGGRLALDPLTPEETQALARALLGEGEGPAAESRVDWVVRESGGSAFFIYELVRHLQAGMTRAAAEGVGLDEVLWRRVQRLPAEARRLLEVVAVAGRPVRLREVQEAAGLGAVPPQVVLALRSGHLVRTTGPHLDDDIEAFHDRIRESVVAHLPPAARRDHHAGLAAALEASGHADPEALAVHCHESGRPAEASRHYAAAAAQAVRVLAFERAEEFFRQAAALAPGDLERADVYEQMIHFYTDLARFADAYAVAREAVQPFGVRLPAKFVPPLFLIDFIEAKWRLRGRKAADLLHLPAIADPRLAAAVRLMNAVAKAAYQVRPELCVAVATRLVNLCLKHGNTPDCAIGYMVFGAIFQGGVLGNHAAGYEFGRLALALVEKHANARQRAEVNFVVGYFGTSWLRPVAEAEELWRAARRAGLETGDWFHTGCACAGTVMSLYMRGAPLDQVWSESECCLDLLRRANLREPIGTITAVRQAIRNLRGQTRSRTCWSDDEFDEDRHAAELCGYGSRHFAHFVHVARMQTLYLWGDYEGALAAARVSCGHLKESPGLLHSAEHHFYHALVLAALYPTRSAARRWLWRRALRRAHGRLRRWAAQCPDNFLAKERLVAAEWCRLRSRDAEAAACYAAAVAAAQRYGYLQMEALAHELAARFYLARGAREKAATALAAARDAYRRWGATAYADALPERLPGIPSPP